MIELVKQRVISVFGMISLLAGYILLDLISEGTELFAVGFIFFTFLGVSLLMYREERLNKLLKIGVKRR